jgi:protein tyrosine/serine phosphatase
MLPQALAQVCQISFHRQMSPVTTTRKWLARLGGVVLLFVLSAGGYAAYLALSGNVHSLSQGQVYRSGLLKPAGIEHLCRAHGVKSVLNLCGAGRGQAYRAETNTAAALGLVHVDFKLSARRQLTELEMDNLVNIMRELPKPMLIHCTGGADRTSLACALYRYDVLRETPAAAANELSFWYGHIPHLGWSYSIAMDRSFWSHVTNHSSDLHITATATGRNQF